MKQITWTGLVPVYVAGGVDLEIQPGDTAEVPAAIADELVARKNGFKAVKKAKAPKVTAPAADEDNDKKEGAE